MLSPVNDAHRAIHTRLAVVGEAPQIEQAYDTWCNDPRYVNADRLGAWINSYIGSGQLSEALDLFERHLAWCPTLAQIGRGGAAAHAAIRTLRKH